MDRVTKGDLASGATFSPCEKYRFELWRCWDPDKKTLAVIGLNPSTADDKVPDPTVTRCIERAKRLGYGRLLMLNHFAYRSTDPKQLRKVEDPYGNGNWPLLSNCLADAATTTVFAWGSDAIFKDAAIKSDLRNFLLATPFARMSEIKCHWQLAYCLGVNRDGQPKHPLYLSYAVPLIPFPLPQWADSKVC
jgi:hypothetical protein